MGLDEEKHTTKKVFNLFKKTAQGKERRYTAETFAGPGGLLGKSRF